MTSVTIPKIGQGEDVHLGMAEEPEQVLPEDRRPAPLDREMWVPKWRSQKSMMRALVRTGNAIRIRIAVTSMFQVKIGMRNMVMPGARR